MKKKVGFYGGSFDPIHNGHLHIALQALEHYELDEIIFCPAGHSPFKAKQAHHSSGTHRLAMVKEAIEGIKSFSALDLEIIRPGASYTIDTLEKLRELRPADSFFLIVADDQLERFSKWKEYQKIALLAPLKVGARLYRSYEELMKVSSFPVKEKDCFFCNNILLSDRFGILECFYFQKTNRTKNDRAGTHYQFFFYSIFFWRLTRKSTEFYCEFLP